MTRPEGNLLEVTPRALESILQNLHKILCFLIGSSLFLDTTSNPSILPSGKFIEYISGPRNNLLVMGEKNGANAPFSVQSKTFP